LRQKVRMSASENPPSLLVRTGQTPLPPDCGRPLWTAPYGAVRHCTGDFD